MPLHLLLWLSATTLISGAFFGAFRCACSTASEDHQRYRKIVETAQEGIWLLDRQCRTVFVNDRLAEMLGYTPEEMQGAYLFDFLDSAAHTDLGQQFERSTQGMRTQSDFPFLRKDGERIWALLSLGRMHDDNDEVTGVLAMLIDITRLRQLENELLAAGEQERTRISEDLHDGLCQQLTGVGFMCETLARRLDALGLPEAQSAGEIAQRIREAVVQARGFVRGLHPVEVTSDGLMAAIEALATTTQELSGVRCTFICDSPVLLHDNTVATHLYYIAQEALRNATQHAKPSFVELALSASPNRVTLSVTDDGIGIHHTSESAGIGLRIMQHRARLIDATLHVAARPQGGTSVRCSVTNRPPKRSQDGDSLEPRRPT